MKDKISIVASALTEDPSTLVYEDSVLTVRESVHGITRFLTESIIGTDTIFEDMQAAAQYLLDEGYHPEIINEGIWDWMKKLGGGLIQTIKEKVVGFGLNLFGVDPNSGFGKYMKITLANIPAMEIPRMLTDCNFAVNKLTDGLSEYFIRGFTDQIGDGFVGTTLSQTLASAVNDDGFVETIQQKIVPKVCDSIRDAGRSLLSAGQKMMGGQDQSQGQGQPAMAGA